MAQEVALSIVNNLHNQLSTLARSIVTMLADKKVTPWEGMQVGMQAMQLGTYIMTVLQGVDDQTKKDFLYVLEHGQTVLPESRGFAIFDMPQNPITATADQTVGTLR